MGLERGKLTRAMRRSLGIAAAVAAGWLAAGWLAAGWLAAGWLAAGWLAGAGATGLPALPATIAGPANMLAASAQTALSVWAAPAFPLFPAAAWLPGLAERTSARDGWPPPEPWAIAHRGASMHAPENTLAAFDLAIAKGADVIELDVRRSRDGRLVVMHDETVNRTTDGIGRVADLTWDELRLLDAGGSFGPAFAGEPVPSLDDVLDRYAGRVGLLIELKEPALYPGVERDLAEALTRRGLQDGAGGRVAVHSFDAGSMRRLRERLPGLPVGVLVGAKRSAKVTEKDLDRFASFADFVTLRRDLADRKLIRGIHARGMRAFAWTVRHPDEVAPLLEAGVDGIVTDDPDLVPKPRQRK